MQVSLRAAVWHSSYLPCGTIEGKVSSSIPMPVLCFGKVVWDPL
jgi:hypothetical protein